MTEKVKRPTLYLWCGGECQIITRDPDGKLHVCGGDELPESFFEDACDGVTVFEGAVHYDTQDMSPEALESRGLPESAANYDEWWAGQMRDATDAEILAVLGNSKVTP